MKIGINGSGMVQKASVDAIAAHASTAEDQGFNHYWLGYRDLDHFSFR